MTENLELITGRLQAWTTFQKVLASLGSHFRPLLIYHLFFTVLAFVALMPGAAWLSTKMLSNKGLPMVSPEEMLSFLASPAGVGWALLAGSLSMLLIFVHHSGMILIAANSDKREYLLATAALWQAGRRLPGLLALAAIQTGVHLLIASPFLLGMGAAWFFLLSQYDPYYLVSEYPPIFLIFLGICAPLLLGMLICNALVYLRWILAFPVLLLERATVLEALQRSAWFAYGYRLRIASLMLAAALAITLIPGLLVLIFEMAGSLILGFLPENFIILIPAITLFLSVYIILVFFMTFLGTALNSLLIAQIYRAIRGIAPVQERVSPPKQAWVLAWGAEIVLLVFAVSQAGFVLHSFFDFQDEVLITAHRGSSWQAPENTVPAIEQAIADGADYVELDVRQTADGVPVLLHDRDLRRIAGKPREIWELTLNQVRRIDAGEWFHPRFAGLSIPTLQEAIQVVQGRAKLYLEIKSGPRTAKLTQSVVQILQENQLAEQTIVAALEQDTLQKVKRLDPGLKTSLLVHTALGKPDLQILDALAFRAAITDVSKVKEARRHAYELHVWTVNSKKEMSRFIDMGVQNIITDRPDVLAELLQQRAALSDAELFLVKLRNWLRN